MSVQTDNIPLGEACLHELFEWHAARRPQAEAVVEAARRWRYGELNARANRLARYLRELGVGPETRVAILMPRCAEIAVAVLATWKAGGAYVPLDPRLPGDRLRTMLASSPPRVVLTCMGRHADAAPPLAAVLEGQAASIVDVDADAPRWAEASPQDLSRAETGLTDRHLAYVIYTSGSTGRPKGAMVEHRGLANLVRNQLEVFRIDSASRILQFAPFGFDASISELGMALGGGAALCFAPDGTRLVGVSLIEVMRGFGITHLTAPPSVLGELPSEVRFESLVTLSLAGEVPSEALVRRWSGTHRLLNGYGPTEATVCSSVHAYASDQDRAATIGRPLSNTQIYILDEAGRPVPVGATGEIYLGGVGVSRGYEGAPALTAERFLPDPFTCRAGARMYRTGDLGRYQADGTIEYLGRNDRQVKLRGFRVEPAEVEERLLEHPRVLQAAVLMRQVRPGDQRLVAYVVESPTTGARRHDPTPLAQALRRTLAGLLPDYMVPAAFVQLDRMPLNANAKINRAALPDLEPSAYAWRSHEALQGPVEDAVAQIWSDVLGVPDVSRNDNFFELGGNSLLAARVVDRMLQVRLNADVRTLYAAPTVAALAAAASRVRASPAVDETRTDPARDRLTAEMFPLVALTAGEIDRIVQRVPGGARNVQDVYPLAPLQEGLLFHHRLSAHADSYRLWTMYHLPGRDEVTAYIRGLQEVIDRHDIFRTAILWEHLREPVQVLWRRAKLVVDELKLDRVAPVAAALVERFNRGDFALDLQCAPLIRLIVAPDPAAGGFVVMEVSHHMITDRVTQDVIQDELCARLQGSAATTPSPVPFREFIAQVRGGLARADHEAFFTDALGAVDQPTAPFDVLDVQGGTARIVEAERDLGPELAERVRRAARGAGVSPATLHHVAWGLVLSRLTGRADVVFGTVLSGRSYGAAAQQVAGLCANTLPVRLFVDERSCADAVRATHQALTQLMVREHASLALAQRCSGVAAPTPLFTTVLNYRYGDPERAGEGIGERHAVTRAFPRATFLGGAERTNYPFTICVDDLGDELRLKAQVDARVDSERICGWMATALIRLIEAMEQSPAAPLRGVDVLPAEERRTLLETWNAPATAGAPDACLHELVEASATRTPDAAAIVHQGEALSYAQLNARANQLARHLRELGIGPDRRVALCLERSLDMVVAILAVLKSGGGYVALDPAYPTDRLEYMLGDSDPAALITQRRVQARVSTRLRAIASQQATPLIDLDTDEDLWASQPSGDLSRNATGLTAAHLAYVIYTSGSTGAPKGIAVEHRHAMHFIQWGMTEFGDALEKTLFATSINFDPSVLECFATLGAGGVAVLVGDVLSAATAGEAVSLVDAVPSAMRALLDAQGLPPSVRTVVLGGEELSPALAERIFRESNVACVYNAYGPTEAGYATRAKVRRGEVFRGHIGQPLGTTRLYILDPAGRPTPIGVAGEIHVGGHGVARGYHERPALTGERFLPDVFSAEPGARMYRTGDLGRYTAGGEAEYLGRIDHQVKHRGFRIELGEIEARILEHPTIAQAAVLLREDQPGEKRLVAYVVARPDAAAASADDAWPTDVLRSHLSNFLTNHMVPAMFVALETLPTTPNGKLDRAALPEPETSARTTADYETPRDEIEAHIAAIWMDLLGVGPVGRRDHFFDLGGHSLLAMVVAARLRTGLGVEVALSELLARPMLCDLAAEVRRVAAPSPAPALA